MKGVALVRGWRQVPLALSYPHEGIPFPLWAGEWQTPAVEQSMTVSASCAISSRVFPAVDEASTMQTVEGSR